MSYLESSGSFNRTRSFLDDIIHGNQYSRLEAYAEEGVRALEAATPQESGLTSRSWGYEIVEEGDTVTLWWKNDNVVDGFNIAIGLQYGHGTGNGGWIEGQDYINPALKPVMDKIAENVWKEVVS